MKKKKVVVTVMEERGEERRKNEGSKGIRRVAEGRMMTEER